MTFKILHNNRQDPSIKRTRFFKDKYKPYGYFYEHKHNTVGFDFKESDLKALVKKYEVDPVTLEIRLPRNYSDIFAKRLANSEIVAFQKLHLPFENHIIKHNYYRFEVWEKK
ncbi:MAG: hypothetical protein KJ601_00535 [Nanoarchaeota archaeon]|nr:hypothetical protein [Nanoarchaeota archaeon]MBU1704560.1 hypothetical protein [Nanoarchaeota archaeon]